MFSVLEGHSPKVQNCFPALRNSQCARESNRSGRVRVRPDGQQLTHKPVTAFTSSGLTSFGTASMRSRLAFALGVAASAPVARKIGHMRLTVVRVRQSPQPEQRVASSAGEESFHTNKGVGSWELGVGSSTELPFAMSGVLASSALFTTSTIARPTTRSGHASRLGSGPTIFPGFKRFFGSKMRFSSRNTG
jgi:hypothetical protein